MQQSLAADAAAVMRQAVSAARRRGHAQVTPLHVASAILSSDSAAGAGLLRAACLRSRSSTPLQCKALEFCLNVALSRLATTGGAHHPAAAFGGFQHRAASPQPALSNALAAAFKRAQPSQRRGGSSSQGRQQQGAVNEIEIEQLVVSILDDPSVSRVMREAGFSSAEVKAHVEKPAVAASSEHSSNNTATGSASPPNNPNDLTIRAAKPDVAGDAARVLDAMASGSKQCVAVVGEGAEAVVKAVMDRASRGENLLPQHEGLRRLQFVPLSLRSMRRDDVDAAAGDLSALVRRASAAAGKGVAVVLEDLGPTAEAWAAAASSRRRSGGDCYDDSCYYCPVEHAVAELSRLVRGDHDVRFWVLAFGSHAAYAVCRAGQPSLEAVLGMHPVVVPHGGLLALSVGGDRYGT
jgi:ATP-dependent Clp protease ATP-binding subunit ClpA